MLFAELHKLELDSLSVQCPYGALGYSWGRKAWCRQGQAQCSLVVSTVYPSTWGSNGARNKSSSIQDDTRTRTVTITMDKLQVQDSGVYWCALYNPNQRPAFIRIMEVRLSVDKSEYLLADFGLTSLAQSPFSPVPQQEGAQHCPCTAPTHVSLHVCLFGGHSGGCLGALQSQSHSLSCCRGGSQKLPQSGTQRNSSSWADPGAPEAAFPLPHLVTHTGLLLQTSLTAKHCSCSGLALHFG